jgi:ABC-type phosphate transport system substrate-binding protein
MELGVLMKYLLFVILSIQMMMADIVVVVHKDMDVSQLTQSQVKKIFLARKKHLPSGQFVNPADHDDSKEIYKTFYDKVAHKSIRKMKKYWVLLTFTGKAVAPRVYKSDKDIVSAILSYKNIIAYIDNSSLTKDLKVIYTLP